MNINFSDMTIEEINKSFIENFDEIADVFDVLYILYEMHIKELVSQNYENSFLIYKFEPLK